MKKMKIIILCLFGAVGALSAEPTVESVEDLRKIQAEVKKVVQDGLPNTVSIVTNKGASGSGVVVSEEGLILTAGHVIRGASEVDIIFPNGKIEKAKVLGANFSKDSAMCKLVNPGPWKFSPIAEPKDLEVGQYVVAMGHATGFDEVRTPPVRFGRVLSNNTNYFVSTDCTLIGGDSGGPLFDLKGRVVGIHSNIGLSWNINNHAGISGFHRDWERLEKGEKWGVLSIDPMTNLDSPAIGIKMGANVRGGVTVHEVLPNGPVAKAGIRAGDIILKLNDNGVKTGDMLIGEIMRYDAGEKINLTIRRNGEVLKKEVTLGRREQLNGFNR